jgi:hypothetical protein
MIRVFYQQYHLAILNVGIIFLKKTSWWSEHNLFGWLVTDGWCWFVLREEYCWLVAGGWFVVREK